MNQREETRYAELVTLSEEEQRLERQGRWLAPLSRCFLQMAGITAGMQVLDVGCGVGDVSLLLAEQVGPDGSVTGIDHNAGFLEIARRRAEAARLPNVTFVEGDLATVDLAGSYDALVGRLVLGFLQERSAILRRLAAQVRPGGIVAFQEIDLTATGTGWPAAPLFQRAAGWVIEVFRRNRLEMGLQLYGLFLEAGLPAPQMALLAPVGGGPMWPGYENLAHVIRSLLPILLTQGIAREEEIAIETLQERLREEMISSGSAAIALGLMSAWTRLP
jgi:SAM-dependent methyltransferase